MTRFNSLLLILLTQFIQHSCCSFELMRGKIDRFSNPNCVESSCRKTCSQYFAKCDPTTSKGCAYCVCDKDFPTYVSAEERCVADEDINRKSAPKYSSFSISDDLGDGFVTGGKNGALLVQNTNTGTTEQLWIYTTNGQIMNMKTLECIDASKHSNIALRQCRDTVSQQWQCNQTFYGIYQVVKGKELYVGGDAERLFLSYLDQSKRYEWVAYVNRPLKRAICERPDVYQGCYRFQDGSFITNTWTDDIKTCGKYCYQEIIISAPIIKGHTNCSLLWDSSLFLVNNRSWQTLSGYQNNNFKISNYNMKPRELVLEMNTKAKTTWSGALLNLQIRCADILEETFEQHCILLKFQGKYMNVTPSEHTSTASEHISQSTPYKASTIALSIIVCVLLLLLIMAVLHVFRRKLHKWKRKDGFSIQEEPFCEDEDI